MCQLSCNGEMNQKKVKALIGAAINNNTSWRTRFQSTTSTKSWWRCSQSASKNPRPWKWKIKEWIGGPTLINLWFAGTKKELIHYVYLVNKLQVMHAIFHGHPMPFDIPSEFIFCNYYGIVVLFSIICLSLFSFVVTFRGYYFWGIIQIPSAPLNDLLWWDSSLQINWRQQGQTPSKLHYQPKSSLGRDEIV